MAREVDSQFKMDVFLVAFRMVLRTMWPATEFEVQTFRDERTLVEIIRVKMPTPSGGTAYVTEQLPLHYMEQADFLGDYRISKETIATITLLLG